MDRRSLLRNTCSFALVSALPAVASEPSSAPAASASAQKAAEEARAAEIAFAQSMADRDFEAFLSHVAEDAVFINGGKELRGRAAIGESWKRFYEDKEAPFSWKPDLVVAIDSGLLAYSTGPVAAPDGSVSTRFASTWRRDPDGRWQVVFDNGYAVCPKPA